jgi:hypothetical protein
MANRGAHAVSTNVADHLRLVHDKPPHCLAPEDLYDLEYVFHRREARGGYRSIWGSMVAAACGLRGEGVLTASQAHDRMGDAIEGDADRRRGAAATDALLLMAERGEGRLVTVLYRLFGPILPGLAARVPSQKPEVESDREKRDRATLASMKNAFRDLLPIVELTDHVQEERRRLAELAERSRWSDPTGPFAGTETVARELEWMERWRDPHRVAELSAWEVLVAKLTYVGGRDAQGKPDKGGYAAWELGFNEFVSTVRRQAWELRAEAAVAYVRARRDG